MVKSLEASQYTWENPFHDRRKHERLLPKVCTRFDLFNPNNSCLVSIFLRSISFFLILKFIVRSCLVSSFALRCQWE